MKISDKIAGVIAAGFIMLAGTSLFAAEDFVKSTEPGKNGIVKLVLRNGATVLTKEIQNGLVSFQVWFRTGSRDEEENNSGISHFIEHLIFKGSASSGVSGLSRLIEGRGGNLNGATSKDFTNFHFETAKEHFYVSLDGMLDCLANPAFDEKEIEKERKVVIEEIVRGDDDPGRKIYEELFKLSYPSHPYRREVIGTKEVLEKLTRADITAYYSARYSPERMIIVGAGDFKTAEFVSALEKHFPAGLGKPLTEGLRKKASFAPGRKEFTGNYGQGYYGSAWLGPAADNSDTYAMDLLVTLLGSGRSSRLYSKLKEKEQLCYSLDMGYSTMRDEGLVYVTAELPPDSRAMFDKRLLEELKDVCINGVVEKDFAKAKAILENSYIFSHETDGQMAGDLGYNEAIINYEFGQDYLENVRKVTAADLKLVAAKYLSGVPASVALIPADK